MYILGGFGRLICGKTVDICNPIKYAVANYAVLMFKVIDVIFGLKLIS